MPVIPGALELCQVLGHVQRSHPPGPQWQAALCLLLCPAQWFGGGSARQPGWSVQMNRSDSQDQTIRHPQVPQPSYCPPNPQPHSIPTPSRAGAFIHEPHAWGEHSLGTSHGEAQDSLVTPLTTYCLLLPAAPPAQSGVRRVRGSRASRMESGEFRGASPRA